MKKQTIISLLLVATLILTLFAGSVAADTNFKGTHTDGTTFTFDRSTFVKEIQLPEGSDLTQQVKCTTESTLSFTITAPGYALNEKGIIRFEIPIEVFAQQGFTWHDVVLYQGETPLTTYLYGRTDEIAIYEAEITSPGKFTVRFEEGASQSLPIKGDLTKVQEKKKQSTTPTPATTAKSPFPVVAILLGLGAAVFAVSRKH